MGDGIGPEVTRQAVKVLDVVAYRFGHVFTYSFCSMGSEAIDKTGTPLPEETIATCLKSDAVLLGAIGHPKYDNDPGARVRPEQGLLRLREVLQLYANIRPISTYPALQHLSPVKSQYTNNVDFLIFRELTGGIYFGKKELRDGGKVALDDCVYSKAEIERIAIIAFSYAQQRRKKLALVDKANVLETSRLWRVVVQGLASSFPDVQVDYLFVDNAAMQIILNPRQFDVLLTDNMFGDIISDAASVLVGSIGLLPSASIGVRSALFEPVHGSYPQAAGLDIANPVGAILSAAMMLEYFGLTNEAGVVRAAVQWVLENGLVSKDINSSNYYSTTMIGDVLCDCIENGLPSATMMQHIELGKSTII